MHILAQQLLALVLQLGAIDRDSWRNWLARLPPFANAAAVEEIIAHLLAEGILFNDGAALIFGREGERAFGRKNFLELFSVFTSPPLVTVLHGRDELGHVHPSSFVRKPGEPMALLLGGQRRDPLHQARSSQRDLASPSQPRWSMSIDSVACWRARSRRRLRRPAVSEGSSRGCPQCGH